MCVSGAPSNLQVLYDELMEGYNPGIRPVLKSSDTVQVQANLKTQQIISLVSSMQPLNYFKNPPPPGHPNSFDFMQFLGNLGKIVCWRPTPTPGSSIIVQKFQTNDISFGCPIIFMDTVLPCYFVHRHLIPKLPIVVLGVHYEPLNSN